MSAARTTPSLGMALWPSAPNASLTALGSPTALNWLTSTWFSTSFQADREACRLSSIHERCTGEYICRPGSATAGSTRTVSPSRPVSCWLRPSSRVSIATTSTRSPYPSRR